MNIRTKVILAQAPLGAVLIFMGLLSIFTVLKIGNESRNILSEDYKTTLLLNKTREAVYSLDRAAIAAIGSVKTENVIETSDKLNDIDNIFVQINKIVNEEIEAEAVANIKIELASYKDKYIHYDKLTLQSEQQAAYSSLHESSLKIDMLIDHLLGINQDSMLRKNDNVDKLALSTNKIILFASICAFIFGSLSSYILTGKMLRPLEELGDVARSIGNGNLEVRVNIEGSDEVAALAREFNFMATRLEKFQQSSIGELLHAQLAMQAAIDSLPEPVIIFGINKQIQNVNETATHMLGLKSDSYAENPLDTVPEPLRSKLEEYLKHVLTGKGEYHTKSLNEAVLLKIGDEKFYFLPHAQPVYEQGVGIVAATVILQDVTKAYLYDLDKSQTLANISHELRIPLESAHMAIHACIEETIGDLNSKQQELLHSAREDCEQMQSMIREILEVSRLEDHDHVQSTRYYHPTQLKDLVEDSLAFFEKTIHTKKITVNMDFPPFMDEIWADSDRLRVVFNNLISNAIRHSSDAKPINIRVVEEENNIRFEIHNFGDPIPSADKDKIFTKFYRSSTGPSGGQLQSDSAGLGLFIAREIILEHGGKIGADSTVEDGTTFWFLIPSKRSFFESDNED